MIVRRSALVPQPAAHVFDVIEAAEHYPQFLPWCTGVTIVSRDADLVSAELQVQWRGMRFEVRTRNPKQRPSLMTIQLERGPFRHFMGEWRLTELSPDACKVSFLLDYELESRWMTNAAGPVFNHLADKMVDAFVQRAMATPVANTFEVATPVAVTSAVTTPVADTTELATPGAEEARAVAPAVEGPEVVAPVSRDPGADLPAVRGPAPADQPARVATATGPADPAPAGTVPATAAAAPGSITNGNPT